MRDDYLVHGATPATATFLFSDIEGSTQLLRSHRHEYASILADHHRLLREAFAAHGGKEIDNQGDAFFVAFLRARDAVLAAAACQRALAGHLWPGGATVRVRMGMHTGEADVTIDRYVGLSVHRAARICSIGHGGQVLVSPTTAGLLDDEEDLPGIALRSVGEHRLKDISRPVQLYQLDIAGLDTRFPALTSEPSEPSRRKRAALGVVAILALAATAVAVAWLRRAEPPPVVLPDSVVRFDTDTLEPTDVFPIGKGADLVVAAGGYVWVTHHVLRDSEVAALRNERTLTRVDPSTGDVVVVGGGLAPCGLTEDPSGDVWVANCFAPGTGQSANVVRIDATSLDFKATWLVPNGEGFFRGLAYGGGSLWVSDVFGPVTRPQSRVTRVDPETGVRHSIPVEHEANLMAWSEGYGDLWMSNFADGSVSRMHAATEAIDTVEKVATIPSGLVVDGDTVWIGDWSSPAITRVPAVGSGSPRKIVLPVPTVNVASVVWGVDAGAGGIWAATPRFGYIWRIDPKTNAVTRILVPHLPSFVAVDDGSIWVTVRAR